MDVRLTTWGFVIVASALLSPQSGAFATSEPAVEAFEFLHPTIRFSDDEKQQLDDRAVVLRILPASGHELATLVAGAIDVGPDAFVSSVRDIATLKKGPFVPQIQRFSARPRLEDLASLTLDVADLDEVRRCAPDRCSVKLSPDEVRQLQLAMSAGRGLPGASVDEEFRRIVLDRARRYLGEGDDGAQAALATLLQHSPYVYARMPQLVPHLTNYPAGRLPDAESFLYWSKEIYGWKPIISVTHVTILRRPGASPDVLVASRDVFSTRYTSGSLVLSALFRNPDSGRRYLVYINRTSIDGLHALWRPFVEHRVKSQARTLFAAARDRIERYRTADASGK